MELKNKNQLRWLALGLLIAGATVLAVACGGGDSAAPAAKTYTFDKDILPLFTTNGAFFANGSTDSGGTYAADNLACSNCHFSSTLTASAHIMDLGTYQGILNGGDASTVDILGRNTVVDHVVVSDCAGLANGANGVGSAPAPCTPNWGASDLRARLRNTRMPPGWEFDLGEGNRDTAEINTIKSWVRDNALDAVTAEKVTYQTPLSDIVACTVVADVTMETTAGCTTLTGTAAAPAWTTGTAALAVATTPGKVGDLLNTGGTFWSANQAKIGGGTYAGNSPACASCHFSSTDTNSAHLLDLSTYAGILAGADNGTADILGRPDTCTTKLTTDTGCAANWGASVLRKRLRNARMPPGWNWDRMEGNRDTAQIELIKKWVDAGAPEGTTTFK